MRKIVWMMLVPLVMALAPIVSAAEASGLKYTIGVHKFENRAGYVHSWDVGDAWGSVMTDLLSQTGRFIVLGETDMRNAAMDEQDLAASGRTAQGAKAPVTGQLTPAQLLVKGEITHIQNSTSGGGGGVRISRIRVGGGKDAAEINATIYVVDSTTGMVVASKSVVGTSKKRSGRFGYSGRGWGGDVGAFKNDNLGKAVEAAVSEAVDWIEAQLPQIPWTGSVALVKDGQVYVNRGERDGVSSGQEFKIGTADVIRDPETGEVLDESLNELARVRCDSVREKLSICDAISGDGAAVERGMAVHLP